MKKIFPVILLAGALLGGCSLLDKIPAESIRIEGRIYQDRRAEIPDGFLRESISCQPFLYREGI